MATAAAEQVGSLSSSASRQHYILGCRISTLLETRTAVRRSRSNRTRIRARINAADANRIMNDSSEVRWVTGMTAEFLFQYI